MVCVPACVSRGYVSNISAVLHPIQRDGGGGFFYASLTPDESHFSLSCIARLTRKEQAHGRFS